jgi:hypothetical protein
MSDLIDVASVARGNASARKPPANLPASFANISVNDVAQNITVFEQIDPNVRSTDPQSGKN